jgi:hypothetical protein
MELRASREGSIQVLNAEVDGEDAVGPGRDFVQRGFSNCSENQSSTIGTDIDACDLIHNLT